MAKHCVIFGSNESLYVTWLKEDHEHYGFTLIPNGVATFAELLQCAVQQPFDTLWLHASAGIEADEQYCTYDEAAWNVRLNVTARGGLKSLYGWKEPSGGAKAFSIIVPHKTGWAKSKKGEPGWMATASPKQLLMAIHYVEDALGVDVGSSPSATGWRLLHKLHAKELASAADASLAAMHFQAASAADFIDKRPLTEDEQQKRYVLKLDKNSAYIASATSEFYGMGTPVHTTTFDEKAVAVWRVTVHATGDFPFKRLMHVGERWLAGPLVRMLIAMGCEVEIHEGYCFPDKFMLLKSWANKVWTARLSFKTDTATWKFDNARMMAEKAIKQIAVTTLGLTGYHGFGTAEESEKKRPDIKLQTVARTHELMYFNIMKALRQDGCMPIMIATDAVYVLADSTDPRKVCPTYLEREGRLGGYKFEGAIEITPNVLSVLTNMAMPVMKRLELLNKIGWSK